MPGYPGFSFQITARDPGGGRARTGRYETPHGTFDTPAFIFCGTKAAVKTVTPAQVKEAGTSIILSNTYHLMLQPGADVVARLGGLHKFMGWDGPILTDSGGVQEEAPSLRKPVLVMRDTTERPEAVSAGAAELVGTDAARIVERLRLLLTDGAAYGQRQIAKNPYGDGHAADRIVDQMLRSPACGGR